MDIAIRHDEAGHRFVAEVGGEVAELTYVEKDASTVILDHTFVPAALRGGGVAGALAARALDWARASRLRVLPACPYVASYIKRHPEVADLLAG
jgi:hypothetical protein